MSFLLYLFRKQKSEDDPGESGCARDTDSADRENIEEIRRAEKGAPLVPSKLLLFHWGGEKPRKLGSRGGRSHA